MLRMSTVLCFGDSWTHGNSVALSDHLRTIGHDNVKVIGKDYWGSTAEYFANHPNLLPDAVTQSNADYVLLSLGGNDYKNIYWRQKRYIAPWKAVAEIEDNTRTVLDALYARHPDIKVVTYGYDFPGDITGVFTGALWDNSPKTLPATTRFMLFMYNYFGVRFINTSFMRIGGMYDKLSKEYAKKNHSLTYVPLWGTLQQAAESSTKAKLAVKMGSPSPSQYMNDPIHANYEGFSHLLSRLYHSYFKSELAPSPPSLSPSASPITMTQEVTVSA